MINLTEACRMNHRSGGAGRIWELTSVTGGQAKGGDSDISDYKPAPSKKISLHHVHPLYPGKSLPENLFCSSGWAKKLHGGFGHTNHR